MITRKLIEVLKGEKYRKQINQLSAVLVVLIGVFFGFDILTQKQNEAKEPSPHVEAPTQDVVEAVASVEATMPNRQTDATDVVVNRLEAQPETTREAADSAIKQSTESFTLLSTNTPAPGNTPLPTNTATSPSSDVAGSPVASQIYYVLISANVRPCPQVTSNCAVIGSLRKGTSISVAGEVQGDAFQGSTLWYSLQYNGQVAYVHSALVSPLPPTP